MSSEGEDGAALPESVPALVAQRPGRSVRDWGRTAVDASVAAIPVAGGPALVLLQAVVKPKYDKRVDAWLDRLGEVINDLSRRIESEELLAEMFGDDLFIDAVTRATQIALGTGLESKISMLQAALTNVGAGEFDDDLVAMRFLDLIAELAPEHFLLLKFAASPSCAQDDLAGARTPRSMLHNAGLGVDDRMMDLLIFDLQVRGLIAASKLDVTAVGDDLMVPFATDLGSELIDFVGYL